ncbi:hypothetical protein OFC63_32730, partial [Escherichia coli]|nr:hypothetical protein [Escherichia coli]
MSSGRLDAVPARAAPTQGVPRHPAWGWLAGAVALAALAAAPAATASDYWLSLGINLLQYAEMATAWALFS